MGVVGVVAGILERIGAQFVDETMPRPSPDGRAQCPPLFFDALQGMVELGPAVAAQMSEGVAGEARRMNAHRQVLADRRYLLL